MGDGRWSMEDDRLSLQARRKLKTETSRLEREREKKRERERDDSSLWKLIEHGYYVQIVASHFV